jgi:hypothetical protein
VAHPEQLGFGFEQIHLHKMPLQATWHKHLKLVLEKECAVAATGCVLIYIELACLIQQRAASATYRQPEEQWRLPSEYGIFKSEDRRDHGAGQLRSVLLDDRFRQSMPWSWHSSIAQANFLPKASALGKNDPVVFGW